jgi:hypothetical protein
VERLTRAAAVLGIYAPGRFQRLVTFSAGAMLLLATIMPAAANAAGPLSDASVALSDPRPGLTSNHTFAGSSVDGATAVKCVRVVWATTPTGDTAPAGFNGTSGTVTAGSSTLINSSASGWSLARSDGTASSGQNNIFQYTNSTGVTPSTTTGATFILGSITNPTTPDTAYYFRLTTFGNTDCSSSQIDTATVQFLITNGSTLSLNVDPTLAFSIGGVNSSTSCDGTTTTGTSTATTIPFGATTAGANRIICQDLSASTNATHGYTIYLRYTGAPSNGMDTIADSSGTNDSPAAFSAAGTEAYGYSTDDASLSAAGNGADRFTNPSQGWAKATTSNAEIAYEATPVGTTHYFIGHQVGISLTTPAGTYQTSIIYTCTPTY